MTGMSPLIVVHSISFYKYNTVHTGLTLCPQYTMHDDADSVTNNIFRSRQYIQPFQTPVKQKGKCTASVLRDDSDTVRQCNCMCC